VDDVPRGTALALLKFSRSARNNCRPANIRTRSSKVRGGHSGADDIARRHLEALEESRGIAEELVERLRLLPGDPPRR
jgi:hypothetical protein